MLITTERPIIIIHPDEKLRTKLFLPPKKERTAEGGLRTIGYFKHNYKGVIFEKVNICAESAVHTMRITNNDPQISWFICDTDNNPVKPAPHAIQKEIGEYFLKISSRSYDSLFKCHASPPVSLPLITIITVVLNGGKTLEQTIKSVINQTYPNVEYIIIDGGSTDGTLDILKKYNGQIDYWVSEPDNGLYDAINKGVSLSSGGWIYSLGADDVMFNCLSEISKNIRNSNTIYYGNVFLKKKKEIYAGKFSSYRLLYYNISHQSIFYPRKIFKFYKYNTLYPILADYELNIRCHGDNSFSFEYMPFLIAEYDDIHGLSSNNTDEQFYTDRKEIIKTNFSLVHYILFSIRHRIAIIFNILKIKNIFKKIFYIS